MGALKTAWRLLGPIFFFFFDGDIKFYGVKTDYFQGSTAIGAFDDITLISVFIYLNVGVTFRAGSSWHLL